jgi:carboxypeptidase Q
VKVPHWVRGSESATLVEPRNKSMYILGLGNSVGTPPEGILAEVLVVKSFDDLKEKAASAKGKIIVYNQDFVSYGTTVPYRSKGATEAAKVGGVASLIRSITPFSLNTPHTGMQTYGENVTQIPTACITIEDAHLLQRLQDEGYTIKILLQMGAQILPDVTSRNTVVELTGTEQPEKVVIVSGHLDSWDVGEGAMDDGGGVFISWGALALLKSLGLKAKRTIRGIFWTAEEFGYVGAYGYAKDHANETDNFLFVMESDIGTFNPVGLEYAAGAAGGCIINEIMQ